MCIDYGMGLTNIDKKNGIRYGVIPQNAVLQAWADSSEGYYGRPDGAECLECGAWCVADKDTDWGDSVECECGESVVMELPDCGEPVSHYYTDDGYEAECGDDGDIFITKSKYYTLAEFCSPCAPGACYLLSPSETGEKAYCFGADWFDESIEACPYPVYEVTTGKCIYSPAIVK